MVTALFSVRVAGTYTIPCTYGSYLKSSSSTTELYKLFLKVFKDLLRLICAWKRNPESRETVKVSKSGAWCSSEKSDMRVSVLC